MNVSNPRSAFLCKQLLGAAARTALCDGGQPDRAALPARTGTAAVLHTVHSPDRTGHHIGHPSPSKSGNTTRSSPPDASSILEAKKQLAVSVGDQIALSLSNLNMQLTLQQQAIRDPLTGLYNRRYMAESLSRELHRAKRKNLPLSVMMMDIDHFKTFNDSYGHDMGDAVLRELGTFLTHNARAEDIACRYGGEEFLLIFPETTLDSILVRAEQLHEGIGKIAITKQGQTTGNITVSIGVACFPEHGESSPDIIRAADSAMYQAKSAGRNQLVIHQNP